MTIVSAFLLPGHPLLYLRQDNPPWEPLVGAHRHVRQALERSQPDVVLMYSTRWFAVLDQLWQTRGRVTGVHVDEDWYEFGDLPFDIRVETQLAQACVEASTSVGIKAKPVDYEGFPIDSGTITACNLIDPEGRFPIVLAANNLYHDWATTEKLAGTAAAQAMLQNKRVAVIGVGGLSGGAFRHEIALSDDRISADGDDAANRRLLDAMTQGDSATRACVKEYLTAAKPDMGLKHLAWIAGATGGWTSANVLAYGPTYGAGAAVVEFLQA